MTGALVIFPGDDLYLGTEQFKFNIWKMVIERWDHQESSDAERVVHGDEETLFRPRPRRLGRRPECSEVGKACGEPWSAAGRKDSVSCAWGSFTCAW